MGAIRAFVAAVSLWAAMGVQAEPAPPEHLLQILQKAQANVSVRVLIGVQLAEPYRPEAELDVAQGAAQRRRMVAAQDQVADLIAGLGGRTSTRYRFVPYLAAEVPAAAVSELIGSPLVASVSADRLRQPALLRSTALIGADQAWRHGLTGAGWTVALPDTGIDGTHPFLAGQVVAEACDSSTFGGNGLQPATVSLCPGGAESSTQAGSGTHCDAALADCDHGTHIAGIVAGRNGPDGLSGIAPEAKLIALQIYSRRADGSGIGAWDSDLLKALERVYALRDTQPITAVNLSLAGTEIYSDQSVCETEHPALADAIELLRSVGIATVAAAGNDAATDALAAPACLSNVISVGASCTAGPDAGFCANGPDSIATYSNVSSFLGLLAPGSYITSSIPGDGYETLSGTSMAAPHVAGALALLRQHSPDADPDELLQRLREATAAADDQRSGAMAKELHLLDLQGMAVAAARGSSGPGPGVANSWPADYRVRTAPKSGSAAVMPASQPLAVSVDAAGRDDLPRLASAATAVAASAPPQGVIVAGGNHTCARSAVDGVKCWGSNASGELGDGTTTQRLTPVDVIGLTSGVGGIAAGSGHTCALTTSGGVKCWGDNFNGQLGDGTTMQRTTAVDVVGLSSGVMEIATGGFHTCALMSTGGVKCWGDNGDGQLGDGTTLQRLTPVDVVGLTSGVTTIAAGLVHTCALTGAGVVKCWGSNGSGRLGDGTTTQRLTPVDVIGLPGGANAIAAGVLHTCAIGGGGGAKCWGYNGNGQLGDGSTIDRSIPTDVAGLASGVAAIAAGYWHTCAVTAAGGVKCWGDNSYGQLGDNGTLPQLAPVDVTGFSGGVDAVAAGYWHTCAVSSTSGAKCWGRNDDGQLGDNSTLQRSAPVDVIGLGSLPDWAPDNFSFASQTGVALGAMVSSNAIVPSGYSTPASVAVTDGEYSIGCTGSFTSAAGTISPGQSVCVRHTAASTPSTTVTTTLMIGGVAGTFSSTTVVAPVAVAVVPTSVDFGAHSMFTPSVAKTLTVSNTGAVAVTINALATTGPFAVKSHTCGTLPAGLAAGTSCMAELTFTPPGEGAYNGSLTVFTTASNPVVPLSGTGERSLVAHYYSAILGRDPDAVGKAWWQDQVVRMQGLGADINEVWYAMAMGFFNSTEYLGFGKTDGEFIDDLYRTFLNREPEAIGRAFWEAQIAQGLTREVVLVAFMFSDEFRAFTASIFGNTAVRPELNMLMDFYRGLLSRLPDDAGFGFWKQQLRKAQCTGAAAVTAEAEAISGEFARGAEYASRNRTNSQYTGDLYNGFLRRGGDGLGVQFWNGLLDGGALTREQVRQQFVASPEFQGRVQQIIAAGCLP